VEEIPGGAGFRSQCAGVDSEAAGSFGGRRGNYGMRSAHPGWDRTRLNGERVEIGASFPDFSCDCPADCAGAAKLAIEAERARRAVRDSLGGVQFTADGSFESCWKRHARSRVIVCRPAISRS